MIQETHIFSSSSLNTLKVGFNRGFLASQLERAEDNLAGRIGFQNLNVSPIDFGLPRIQLTGYTQLGHSVNTFRNWTNIYSVTDGVNLVRGRHSLTVGGEAANNRVPQTTTNGSNGRLTYTGRFTGDSVADYLLGAYSTALATSSGVVQDFRNGRYAAFIQDDYKPTGRLALNLGLRWEYNQPIHELGGSEAEFDPSIPGLRLAKDPRVYGVAITSPYVAVGGLRAGVVKPEFLNFAPRIGFALMITSKTVLRGGIGTFFATNQQSDLLGLGTNPAAGLTTSYSNSPGAIPRLASTLFDRVASTGLPPSTQLSVEEANRKNPYLNQVSLSIQQALPLGAFFEVGYVGSVGRQLTGREDLNQAALNSPGVSLPVQPRRPYPMFASIWQFFGGENSNYNAMTASVERRFARNWGMLANYTFARSMDSTSGLVDGNSPHQISNNRRLEYGRSAFDVRNRLAASASYQLPFWHAKGHRRGILDTAMWTLSGWQVNTIAQFQSGLPFSVLLLTDRSNTGTVATQRPNRIATGNLPADQRTPNRWFDTSAFVLNSIDTYGNSGRNILDQDGTKSVDLSLLKNNRLSERFVLQFRVELFNVFDWSNYGPPGNYLDGPNFGIVTTMNPSRQTQLACKIMF